MAPEHPDPSVDDRRRAPRKEFAGRVRVVLDAELNGQGQNISKSGMSMVVDGTVEVLVHVHGREEPVRGELVRLTPMGDGTGLAVRFLDGAPPPTPRG